jgi:hypothetical protein
MDAANANGLGAISAMTPAEQKGSMAASGAGFNAALGGVQGPQTAPAPVQKPADAVFASGPAAGGPTPPQTFPMGGGGGVAATVIPAHEGTNATAKTEHLYDKAEEDKQRAADLERKANEDVNEAQRNASLHTAGVIAAQNNEAEFAERKRARAYDAQQADYEKIQNEANEGKITAKHAGFMGIIGSALGAFGASINHTPNFAAEAINKRIDDDLATQRDNLANKRAGAAAARSKLGELRERYGDERAAEAAYRARELEQAKATGDVMVAQAKSPLFAAKWADQRAAITQEQAKIQDTIHPLVQAKAVGGTATPEQLAQEALHLYTSGGGNLSMQDAQRQVYRAHGIDPMAGAAEPGAWGGKAGGGVNARGALKVAAVQSRIDALQRLSVLARSGSSLSKDQRAQAEQMTKELGIPGLSDNPLAFTDFTGQTRIQSALKTAIEERNNMSRALAGASSGGGEDDSAVKDVE